MGPILAAEFEDKLARQNIPVIHEAPPHDTVQPDYSIEEYQPAARIGQISHIGGHKWAGNVIAASGTAEWSLSMSRVLLERH
jgi:hypothetical protein